MQSAFVDIGLERDGFLYVTDVVDTIEEFERLESGDEEDEEEGGARREREAADQPKIEDLIREGQEIIVQVAKEPLGTKGARLTSHVTMAGRFLVFMPTVDHVGVSRKIESREERARLRGIVREFREKHGFTGGVIIRTAAAEPARTRTSSRTSATSSGSGTRCGSGPSPCARPRSSTASRGWSPSCCATCSPTTTPPSASTTGRSTGGCREMVERVMPSMAGRVKLYDKPFPIFEEYGVQAEIDKALASKVWLKSGGYIVINQTEALVAIDVNTGRYVGKKNGRLEDTIVKTNLEAVKEIVRQIRLRDLGGIIVLDFIDMEEKKNRQKVFQAVELELKKDRSPSKALQVSDFGLDHHHAQAREAEPRAHADRAVPVLLGERRDQVQLDDLLRDPGRGAEDRPRAGRPGRGAAREPGHRARAEGRGERRAARAEATLCARTSPSAPTRTCTTSSST